MADAIDTLSQLIHIGVFIALWGVYDCAQYKMSKVHSDQRKSIG